MKILMCHKYNFLMGGAERYLFDLRDGLRSLGQTVIDFSTLHKQNEYSDYSAYFIKTRLNSNSSLIKLKVAMDSIYSFAAKEKLSRLIDDCRPDIAHIHNIYHHISSSVLHALKKRKIPIVMTLHDYKLICPNYSLFVDNKVCQRCKGGNYFFALRYRCLGGSYLASFLACFEMYFCKMLKMYEDNIDLFIAPSVFIRNKMIEFGVNKKKIYYFPLAINLDSFSPNPEEGNYILYFGRISAKKGIRLLLSCAKRFNNIKFKIAGDGPEKSSYMNLAQRMGLKNVEFLGYQIKDRLISLINGAYFIVVPSEWLEVSGLVIYESFASGKCVVAADTGGIPELVEDNFTGLLFKSGDSNDLAKKISYLLDNSLRRKEFGVNAYNRITKINNTKAHYQELLSIYNKLLPQENNQ